MGLSNGRYLLVIVRIRILNVPQDFWLKVCTCLFSYIFILHSSGVRFGQGSISIIDLWRALENGPQLLGTCMENCHRGFVEAALADDMMQYLKPLAYNQVRAGLS